MCPACLCGREVESAKKSDRHRPELAKAFQASRLYGAKLVIAKLDRLSRDAHFLLGLKEAGVDFVAADMPNADGGGRRGQGNIRAHQGGARRCQEAKSEAEARRLSWRYDHIDHPQAGRAAAQARTAARAARLSSPNFSQPE